MFVFVLLLQPNNALDLVVYFLVFFRRRICIRHITAVHNRLLHSPLYPWKYFVSVL